MIQTQPAQFEDFTGGITDTYINAPINQGERMENLLIGDNKSLLMRPGSEVDDTANAQIPAGTQRIGTLINYDHDDTLFVHSANKLYYRDPSAYATLTGPSGNQVFSTGTTADYVSYTQWNSHLIVTNDAWAIPQKIYRDSGNVLRLRTAGLPDLASNPVITIGTPGAANFVYAFHYHYTYTVGNQTFEDFGPVTYVEVNNSSDPSSSANAISVIPVISNGSTNNYDTAVIKVYIYRSVDGGNTHYKIGEVTNGTTTFNDNYADASITSNVILYTDGGVLSNDPPPLCKFVHVVGAVCYYAHIKEGSEILPNTYIQSVQLDFDSCPAIFRDTVEDEIMGFSSVNETPIIGCRKYIYRVEGQFDEFGRGSMIHIRIHDTAGVISNASFVQAEQMLFWAGNDGFYVTDGYKTFKISDHLNDTYKSLVSILKTSGDVRRVKGVYDEKKRLIYWTFQADSASGDNDTIFSLDLRWGISPNMPFTTWVGGNSFRPTDLEFFDGLLHRADTRGYVLRHNDTLATDKKIDTSIAASLWKNRTIIWDYKGIVTNFGTNFVRKWVPRILVTMKNKSNISAQINAINDDGKFSRSLQQIRYRKNFIWGDPEFVWGNPEFVWNAEGLIEEWRRMPAKGLRCAYMQIQITNAYTIITKSDTLGQATVNSIATTVTLDNAADVDWPADSVDYYISFASDTYTKQYLVTARTDDTLTFSASAGEAPTGSQKWLLKGYKKGEILNLLGYTLHFAMLSKTHTTFTGNEGANA